MKITLEQKIEIINRYSRGAICRILAEVYGVSTVRISQIVRRANAIRPYRPNEHTWKLTQQQKEEVRQLYIAGKTGGEIAAIYKIGKATPYRVLRKFGIAPRDPSSARRKLSLDETAFDSVTEASAYWVGFLMADGAVKRKGGAYQICLWLAEKDKDHIEKFRAFLKSQHKIGIQCNKQENPHRQRAFGIVVQSNRLATKLIAYGVVPNKTFVAKVHGLEYNRHFWRGVIDGDGSLGFWQGPNDHRRYPTLRLYGARPLMDQFLQFVKTVVPTCGVAVHPNANIFRLQLISFTAQRVIKHLYSDCNVALPRKLELAKQSFHMRAYWRKLKGMLG